MIINKFIGEKSKYEHDNCMSTYCHWLGHYDCILSSFMTTIVVLKLKWIDNFYLTSVKISQHEAFNKLY